MYAQVRRTVINGRSIDLGVYLNPDDIGRDLRTEGVYDARMLRIKANDRKFRRFAMRSGLIGNELTKRDLTRGCRWIGQRFKLIQQEKADRFAQLLTQFLCDQLLVSGRKFSFETVFSHPSKLDLMRRAGERGYKVYLYFIATNSAELNIDRVKTRVLEGGHDVPPDKVRERYLRSLEQLLPAIDLCYHAFVFDNSGPAEQLFAEMKVSDGGRVWSWNVAAIPDWFIQYYLLATGNPLHRSVAQMVQAARESQAK